MKTKHNPGAAAKRVRHDYTEILARYHAPSPIRDDQELLAILSAGFGEPWDAARLHNLRHGRGV